MLADAKLRAFARLYESNGDLTALPADPKAAQQELLLRCERVVPQMRAEFGLSGSIAVANEVQAFERRFGSLHLPPVESKRVVLRPSEHGCTRVGCKCKCTLVPDNPKAHLSTNDYTSVDLPLRVLTSKGVLPGEALMLKCGCGNEYHYDRIRLAKTQQ